MGNNSPQGKGRENARISRICEHVSAISAEGLTNTLGAIVMQTLKNVLTYPLARYAENPLELHRELSRVFGSGATTLERMITKELFQRLNLRYSNELDFETSVNLARRDMTLSNRGNN